MASSDLVVQICFIRIQIELFRSRSLDSDNGVYRALTRLSESHCGAATNVADVRFLYSVEDLASHIWSCLKFGIPVNVFPSMLKVCGNGWLLSAHLQTSCIRELSTCVLAVFGGCC